MEAKSNDRRINRTRRRLSEALTALILEKGYEAVKVEEVTERADVGRTTFYLHYKDKEELLLENINAAINTLLAQIAGLPVEAWQLPGEAASPASADAASAAALSPIVLIFEHAAENANLYRIILRGEGTSQAQRRIREAIACAVSDFLAMKVESQSLTINPIIPVEVFGQYFAGALLSFLTWWLENDMPYATVTVAGMFQRMSFPGASEVLGVSFV